MVAEDAQTAVGRQESGSRSVGKFEVIGDFADGAGAVAQGLEKADVFRHGPGDAGAVHVVHLIKDIGIGARTDFRACELSKMRRVKMK
jgi:hypothetical protein